MINLFGGRTVQRVEGITPVFDNVYSDRVSASSPIVHKACLNRFQYRIPSVSFSRPTKRNAKHNVWEIQLHSPQSLPLDDRYQPMVEA